VHAAALAAMQTPRDASATLSQTRGHMMVCLVGERESDDRVRRDTNVQEIRRSINRERPTGGDEREEADVT
jgi:hypothetical protein